MLFRHCFDWKISVLQERVVRVYCILKRHSSLLSHFNFYISPSFIVPLSYYSSKEDLYFLENLKGKLVYFPMAKINVIKGFDIGKDEGELENMYWRSEMRCHEVYLLVQVYCILNWKIKRYSLHIQIQNKWTFSSIYDQVVIVYYCKVEL